MLMLREILWLVTLLAISHAQSPKYCMECEQEIWEQVPCSNVPNTTTAPIIETPEQLVISTTTPSASITSATQSIASSSAAPSQAYQTEQPKTDSNHIVANQPQISQPVHAKCHSENKLDCKELNNKDALLQQQIAQYTATIAAAPSGQLVYPHAHQRKYYTANAIPADQSSSYGKPTFRYALPYALAAKRPALAPAPVRACGNINAPNYTLENFAQLISGNHAYKYGYAARPQLPPAYPPALPAYSKTVGPPMQTVITAKRRIPYVNEQKLTTVASNYVAAPQLPYAGDAAANVIKTDVAPLNFDLAIDNYLTDFTNVNQVIKEFGNY